MTHQYTFGQFRLTASSAVVAAGTLCLGSVSVQVLLLGLFVILEKVLKMILFGWKTRYSQQTRFSFHIEILLGKLKLLSAECLLLFHLQCNNSLVYTSSFNLHHRPESNEQVAILYLMLRHQKLCGSRYGM
jgi:hypothetical protein